jgi:signal peptide peptidase SppA
MNTAPADDVTRYPHVLAFALEHPWNLLPSMLAVVASILARHEAGTMTRAEIESALVNRKNLPQPKVGNVGIIPVYGVIAPRMNAFSEISGGTTFESLTKQLRAAVADKSVRSIVLDVDSPGGSVAGNAEFAHEVMRARRTKPVIAQAQYTMASAAYQLAAAATEIVAAPSAQIGGIGTYSIHTDLSKALETVGVKRTYISAGEGKVDGNETEPLSPAALERRQLAVNQAYDTFVHNVVLGRGDGMSDDRVRHEWKAHVYSAPDAKANGMIDRIATLDETLARLTESTSDDRAALTPVSADTPQAREGSGQDRRREAALERQAFELQLLIHGER